MRKNKVLIYCFSIILVIFGILLFLAYIYKPKENNKFNSEYLIKNNTDYVNFENYNAHYLRNGVGEPVILIHGGGSWLYSFQNNINVLSENFEVFALDMPGHGYTVAVNEPKYDLDTYADFILEFMKINNIEKASFVGHSWGGGWVTYFSIKYPNKVNKIILLASSGLNLPDKSEWKYLNYPILGEIITNFISYNATKTSLKNMVYDINFVTELYVNEIYKPLSKINNRRAQYLSQRNMNWNITDNGIEEINNNTILIFGDNDPYFDLEYINEFNEKLENSKLFIIKNTGHLPHEEKYDEVNAIIFNFLLN